MCVRARVCVEGEWDGVCVVSVCVGDESDGVCVWMNSRQI